MASNMAIVSAMLLQETVEAVSESGSNRRGRRADAARAHRQFPPEPASIDP